MRPDNTASPGRAAPSITSRAVRRVVTHPAARAFKRAVRDGWWTVRGGSIANPPVPREVESILFVCLGNICRSPFAAVLATRRLADLGVGGVRCDSAGIRTTQGARPPQEAVEASAAYELSLEGHRPRLLTRELVEANDLIVVMEAGQLHHVRETYPDAASAVVLLSLFDALVTGGFERYHIADPFGQPRSAFDACYGRIDRALTVMLRQLRPSWPVTPGARPAQPQSPR